MLLSHKADINITDDIGVTPLYVACEHNQAKIVEFNIGLG
jgi:ankyrin repeat protein